NVELALDEVEENSLAVVPLQPGKAVEDDLGDPHERPAPVVEKTAYRANVELATRCVEGVLRRRVGVRAVRLRGCVAHVNCACPFLLLSSNGSPGGPPPPGHDTAVQLCVLLTSSAGSGRRPPAGGPCLRRGIHRRPASGWCGRGSRSR